MKHIYIKKMSVLAAACTTFLTLTKFSQAATVATLDGTSVQSTFETGTSGTGTPPAGWVTSGGAIRTFLGGGLETNTALIANPGGAVQAEFDTGVTILPNTTYTLTALFGHYNSFDGSTITATLEIGTFSGLVFTSLATASPTTPPTSTGAPGTGASHSIGEGAGATLQVQFTTGAVVSSDNVGVRIQSSGGGNTGFDNVILDAVAVPEPSTTALFGLAGLALIFRKHRA